MITITKPGLLSSIQDLGRYGFQKYGVITSGVMDSIAHRLANLLVGNKENQPTIEVTLLGPVIQFHQDSLIAICGGDLSPTINQIPIRTWRTILVKKGSELKFGQARAGCRAYLTVAGGFSIPSIMESASTYLRANIGGFHGRALQSGDQIKFDSLSILSLKMMQQLNRQINNQPFVEMEWSISSDLIPTLQSDPLIRVIKGRQYHLFAKKSREKFFTEPFKVTTQADRMGYRLQGPTLHLETAQEMISEAVTFGTIQVPAEGHPIVLLADRQTTGGYPKIGEIASVDLALMVQAKPGDDIYFTRITHEEAGLLHLEREIQIKQLKHGIFQKFRQEE
ncbi:biotin-dependent carboxyltransferase family protein [Bacillus sp. V3B]|uniref:5-oxoprolinase subunit C family protein n=1 Tax=Bacillus sp. V3B TaxID=2804915 RepID=UPI00210933EC|nr:biotin-dependent carboxyltransferase family protein [Bacillus sp. V3B]MCQ6274231.1 biotin-dependent carboxyltransferase family protein [Bacillus sp. V3B]